MRFKSVYYRLGGQSGSISGLKGPKVAEELTSATPPRVPPPFGMFPGKLDDKGRCKLPADIQRFVEAWGEKTLIVTSLDRHKALVYSQSGWTEAANKMIASPVDPDDVDDVLFNANDLGSETLMDSSGRVMFSAELRRELGIEGSSVRLQCFNDRVEVLSDAAYQARKERAAVNADAKVARLKAAKAI